MTVIRPLMVMIQTLIPEYNMKPSAGPIYIFSGLEFILKINSLYCCHFLHILMQQIRCNVYTLFHMSSPLLLVPIERFFVKQAI